MISTEIWITLLQIRNIQVRNLHAEVLWTMNKRKPTRFLILGIVIAAVIWGMYFILIQTGLFQFTRQSGPITIQDAYLTLDPELSKPTSGQTPTFPADTSRIYLAVFLESEIPVHLGVRWYFEDELIFQQSGTFDRPFVWYIQSETEVGFLPGIYRAEIHLIKEPIRILEFTIEETN